MTAPASKNQLVEKLAKELDWPEATTCLHLEWIRDDFAGIFGDRITLTLQRDRFREIERAWREAAATVRHAPQEVQGGASPPGWVAWLPPGSASLAVLSYFYAGASGWLPSKLGLEPRKSGWPDWRADPSGGQDLSFKGWQFEGRIRDDLELIMFGLAVSEAAKHAADKLEQAGLRREGYHPEEKEVARYAWMLLCGRFLEQKFQQSRTSAKYIVANWAKLSPRYREKYNRLRQARKQAPLPEPTIDEYAPPVPIPKPRFSRRRHRDVAALLYRFLTNRESKSLASVCDEVRKEFEA
jgi:hypothetical protein